MSDFYTKKYGKYSDDALEQKFWSLVTAFNSTKQIHYAKELTDVWHALDKRGRRMPDASVLSPSDPFAW